MDQLFETLSHAVESSSIIAIGASFIWGILSIILSPCHLASIPLIVGFIDKQGATTTFRAFLTSTLFSLGILLTIAIIGIITALAGRMMGDIGAFGNYFVAVIFFVVGLHLIGLFELPFSGPGRIGMKSKGLWAAFILGLIFGIALGPCTFAYMAPMLAVTFSMGSERPVFAALLLLMYGVGHCSVIVLAGTFTEIIQRYLKWNESSKGAIILRKVCGVLVIAGGIYLIYTVR